MQVLDDVWAHTQNTCSQRTNSIFSAEGCSVKAPASYTFPCLCARITTVTSKCKHTQWCSFQFRCIWLCLMLLQVRDTIPSQLIPQGLILLWQSSKFIVQENSIRSHALHTNLLVKNNRWVSWFVHDLYPFPMPVILPNLYDLCWQLVKHSSCQFHLRSLLILPKIKVMVFLWLAYCVVRIIAFACVKKLPCFSIVRLTFDWNYYW